MSGTSPHIGARALSLGIVTGSMSRRAGGLFNSVRKSAHYLADAGVGVSVYAGRDADSDADLAAWHPLEPRLLDSVGPPALGYAPALKAALLAGQHDVVHLHGIWQLHSHAVHGWRRKTGRPVMISPRGMLDPWALHNSALKKRIAAVLFENRNLHAADCLHALNPSEAASMRSFGLRNPIAIIPNGTDLADHVAKASQVGPRTMLFVGRIHPKKGLSELLNAWSRLRTADPAIAANWNLVIAGWDDGGHLEGLQREIEALQLANDVSLPGPVFDDAKDALLRSADAFILPSYSEGLPMSVLEAWSYSLPVLMTRMCNLPEAFDQGTAIEIATDPASMAETLRSALARPDLRAVGLAGRKLVERDFGWPHIAALHREVYEWMVGRGDRPDCVMVD